MKKPVPYSRFAILCILLIILGVLIILQTKTLREEPGKVIVPEKKEAFSIFIPGNSGKLAKKTFEINVSMPEREKAELIIKTLKKEKAVPEKLSLNEFIIDTDGIIYLNLSQDIKNGMMSTRNEIHVIYGIVNSFLSCFKDAKKVQLLVNGQALYTIGGQLYTYMPIEFNNQLLED
ncbi:MAG: hypothetical protein C0392_00115 [Syntrophus sp. (in: bacteria)]|nr:hypothetical protein [Syntrophus sp. (in: bacteria)]